MGFVDEKDDFFLKKYDINMKYFHEKYVNLQVF